MRLRSIGLAAAAVALPGATAAQQALSRPVVLTGPFKLAFPWTRDHDQGMFEYACHEGNRYPRHSRRSSAARSTS